MTPHTIYVLIESMCSLSKFLQFAIDQRFLLPCVCPYGLVHRERHEGSKQVHKVGGRGGELDRLCKGGLPRGLKGAKVWDEVIVDEIVVLVHGFVVTLQCDCEVL